MDIRIWPAVVACCAVIMIGQAHAAPGYHLEAAQPLRGASPSWDYLTFDPTRGLLFLGRRADGVTVYDPAAHKVVGQIAQSQGADIAAIIPEADRGYTANEDGTTTVFRLSTLETLQRVKLGESADAAFYEPLTGQVVFTLGDSKELVFVDAKTAQPTGRLHMDAEELEGVAADGRGFLYVNERDRNRLAKIDARTRAVVAEWPLPGCEMPTGLAVDRQSGRLFVGCKGEHPVLAVVDAETGRVIATGAIGRGNDGVIYDAASRRVFASNGVEANIVVFDQLGPDAYRFAGAFTTRPIARTMCLDPKTGKIYTMTAEGVVDPAKPVNTRAGAFYPNRYLDDTLTLLTYAPDR